MKPTEQEMRTATEWARRLLDEGSPVSFGGGPVSVRLDSQVHTDFPAIEWTAHLRNDDRGGGPLVEEIQAFDTVVPLAATDPCTIHYAHGSSCAPYDFGPITRDLAPKGGLRLQAGGGRSSSDYMPFMNIDLGGRGVIVAIGWTGEWAAEFTRAEDGALRVQVGMDQTRLRLDAGEEIRTPRVVLLFWEGDRVRGQNLWRRYVLTHRRPRPAGDAPIAPLTCGNWGGTHADVHLDNIRLIAEHGLPYEYYWIDAGWFGGDGVWWLHNGDWRHRAELYPDGLRAVSEAAHAAGLRFLLWFEPERVAPGTPWAEECKDWLLEIPDNEAIAWEDYGPEMGPEEFVKWESARNQLNRGDRLLNLGHRDARRFLTDFLSDMITDVGIDCLRWDSNIAQLPYWRHADAPDRQGVTEIRYVEGQYALWDELLARHPGLIIDNCGSGARRIDAETTARATPLWRTDHVHMGGTSTTAQCQTHGLAQWVPLNGTMAGYLHAIDDYRLRSTMSSTLQAALWGQGDAPQEKVPGDYPFDEARRLLEQYLSVRDYFHGDFYPLTEYTLATDAWMVYQLDRPEEGDGLVVVLKREHSPYDRATFRLSGLDRERSYEVTDLDSGRTSHVGGNELTTEGLAVELQGAPASALIRYVETDGNDIRETPAVP